MADDGYILSADDVAILREVVSAYRRGGLIRPLQATGRTLPPRRDIIFGVAEAAVEGTSDALSDPHAGTLNVYELTTAGGTTDSGQNEEFWNMSSVARTTSEYTVCVRDYKSGLFMSMGGGGTGGKKPFCRFTLDAELTDATTSVAALLTNQWGEGTAHSTGSITVYNPLDGYTTGCLFEGTSGTAGIAGYDSGTAWVILQLFKYCS